MNLPIRHYGVVLDALRIAAESGGNEKRRHNRVEIQAKIELASLDSAHGGVVNRIYTALTRDISLGGLGLLQYTATEVGRLFVVCLPTDRNSHLHIVCKSVFTRPLAEGVFGVGAEFEAEAPPALVEQIQKFRNGELQRVREKMFA